MSKKILVVDDDQSFLEELTEFLCLSGYDAMAITSAFEALKIMAEVKPDLVLLDLKMPAKSGFQLASEIRSLPGFSKIPIFAMSAFAQDETLPFLSVFGINNYIKKPFPPAQLVEEIEKMFNNLNR
jgi:CheY-like chemotaxis protein